MFEKKAGRNEANNVVSMMRRDDFSKRSFLKHIKYLGDFKEICRTIVKYCFAEYMLEKKAV